MKAIQSIAKTATIALPLIFSGAAQVDAQGIVVIDNPSNTQLTERHLAQSCKSYFAKDVELCVNTQLSLTKGLADAYGRYLAQNNFGQNHQGWLDSQCEDRLNAALQATPPSLIAQNPPVYLPRFVTNGMLASRQCLDAIETGVDVYGIDYNPSSRALLNDMVDQMEQGAIPFRFTL